MPGHIRQAEPGYRRCTTCIMDTTDPWITFDGQGRCSHCIQVDQYRTVWNPAGDPIRLERLIARIRADGKGRDFDAVIGLSGGVDSSFLAYQAKQFGLRMLIVHVDTGWNSELAVSNIENIVKKLGFELHTNVVDWEEMQDLQYAFLKSGVPNQDIPQDHAIVAGFLDAAAKYRIRWSLNGSNLACESILPKAWGYDNMDLRHILDIHGRFGRRKLRRFPQLSYWASGFRQQVLMGMNVAKPLDLIHYVKADAMRLLSRELGWQYYGGKHYESRFTKFFQAWYLPARWGFDKRLAHLSSLIASGQVSREAALQEFESGVLPTDEIERDKDYMASKLGVSRPEFDAVVAGPIHPHSDYRQTSVRMKRMIGYSVAAMRRILGRGRAGA